MMRITSQAVKSSCAHARVFMSLDMYWHGVSGGTRYDGKELIDYVNTYMKAEGDIEWGVAFHHMEIHLRRQSGGMIMQPLMKMRFLFQWRIFQF